MPLEYFTLDHDFDETCSREYNHLFMPVGLLPETYSSSQFVLLQQFTVFFK
jgi:hypothetical protein